MWDKLQKKDKIKLIYAYIISPLMIMGNIGGRIITELYSMYGRNATQDILSNGALSKINLTAFMLGLLGYLPITIPPTVMRFVAIRHELKYGIEIYCYMLLSFFFARVIVFTLTGTVDPTLGFLDSLIIYCILSFRTTEYREIPSSYRYGLTFLTIGAVFIILYATSEHFTSDKQYIFPIWEAIALCLVLNRHKESTELKEPEQPKISYNNNENEQTTYRNQPPEPPHREPRQESEPPQPPQPDIADTLINIGLAHIGRITTRTNPYITPKQTAERHNVERTFLKLLSKRYTDTETHKNLAIYFMVYKEVTLFVIFAMVLKNDKPLLTKIHNRLKVLLSQGLPSKVIASRNEYWHKLSEKIHENYIRTHDLAGTLDYTFWSVLPEKLKGEGLADLASNGCLKQIFDYTREAIAQEYKDLHQQPLSLIISTNNQNSKGQTHIWQKKS